MGVWMNLFVAPEEGVRVLPEKFIALINDLITNNIVDTPCAICDGEFDLSNPLGIANDILSDKFINNKINIRYKGKEFLEMLKNLNNFPFGKENLCIWFSRF